MILVDTSVWIDHLRSSDAMLAKLLSEERVMIHPFVVGELAMGHVANRRDLLHFLQKLPAPLMAHNAEVLAFVTAHSLFGVGIGFVDAHLLASAQLTAGASLWTRDKRLRTTAQKLSIEILPG